jgi:hypothetical protein
MTLAFLAGAGSALGAAAPAAAAASSSYLPLIQAVPALAGVAQSFIGRDAGSQVPTLGPQLQALENSRVYREAAINPESPHHRALSALTEAQRKRDLVAAIDGIMRQQSRAQARGALTGQANPERRDEGFASAIADMFAKSGDQARLSAGDQLSRAAGGESQRAGGFNSLNQIFANFSDENKTDKYSGMDALGKIFKDPEIIKGIENLFSGGGRAASGPPISLLPGGAAGKTSFASSTRTPSFSGLY